MRGRRGRSLSRPWQSSIWNGLDGDATTINVEFAHNDLVGGMSKIVVYDNGDGFPRADANALFGNLGGSWKRCTRHTKRCKRMIHGQEGRGRYKAFALGQSVRWRVCYKGVEGNRAFEIKLLESDLTDVAITEDEPAPERATGVIAEIDDLRQATRYSKARMGCRSWRRYSPSTS